VQVLLVSEKQVSETTDDAFLLQQAIHFPSVNEGN
jgi:hypothetical protein